jgi:arylsulfatase A-like enzyme
VTDTPASTTDIYPTLLDVLDLDMPEDQPLPLDGISIAPAFDGSYTERERPIPFWYICLRGKMESRALIDGRYKIHYPLLDRGGEGKFQLHDVVADVGETHDLTEEKPELLESMLGQLEAWQESVRKSQTGADYPAGK